MGGRERVIGPSLSAAQSGGTGLEIWHEAAIDSLLSPLLCHSMIVAFANARGM